MYKPLAPNNYKPPKLVMQKNPPLNCPSKIPPGGLYLEIALKYKVKQGKNGKFPSIIYKASPIDFETQISFRI